jgi:uncharacterized membrane protein
MAKKEQLRTWPNTDNTLRSSSIFNVDIDLKLALAGTILSVFCIFFPLVNETLFRAGAGLLLCLFLPGYALSVVLFPSATSPHGVARIALSLGLSLVLTPVLAMLANSSPWGITLASLVLSLSAVTIVGIVVAHYRRQRVPIAERPTYAYLRKRDESFLAQSFISQNRFNKILSVVLMSMIIVSAAAIIVYGVGAPPSNQRYTQLYLLDTNGSTIDYPLQYTLGGQQAVVVGITNHESNSVQYNLVLMQNSSSGAEQLYSQKIVLPDNATWQNVINIKPTVTGELKMQFLLYKDNDSTEPYREVYLRANVTK